MKKIKEKIAKKFKYTQNLEIKLNKTEETLKEYSMFVPPGHFYSPVHSLEEVTKRDEKIFLPFTNGVAGVDLNENYQIDLIDKLSKFYKEMPFEDNTKEGLRYPFVNPNFSYFDGIIYYSMIRYIKPKKIVEVGCGYSSCVTLDTNELFFNNSIDCTFIDPYPELFYTFLKEGDKEKNKMIPMTLQDVDIEEFLKLEENDILFIDSTHVSKVDSDVNRLFFEILPKLKKGVYIHLHDIFYPFEYPKAWIYQGISWNENYLLRAFLQYNKEFKITFFNHYLDIFHKEKIEKALPLCAKSACGSIWLQKV